MLKTLIRLDLWVAKLLGAPPNWTLSGWSYKLEQDKKPWGVVMRPVIDFWFGDGHCKKAYDWESTGHTEV